MRTRTLLAWLIAFLLVGVLATGGSTTGISWADSTLNFWTGCRKKSQGCKFCYAERMFKREGKDFSKVTRTAPATWQQPYKWSPRVIFVNSLSDYFIEEGDQWREDAWKVIRDNPQHDFLILTKRPERILEHLPEDWGDGWDHVWIGVSVEDQQNADERLPILYRVPAKHKFVSAEPLIGKVDLWFWLGKSPRIEFVITGGESGIEGMKLRPTDPGWVLDVNAQCEAASSEKIRVTHHHKQNGGKQKYEGEWGGFHVQGQAYRDLPDFHSLAVPPAQMSMF